MRGRLKFDKDINMKKDLLICIAHHFNVSLPKREVYLLRVIGNFVANYKVSLDIIVDTNFGLMHDYKHGDIDIKICVHENLEHPFFLTWKHRQHIKDNIDNYHNFLYIEDDELLPYENYLNYLENFRLLYPNYVPSFVRIEEKDGEQFISDVPEKQPLSIIEASGKQFVTFPFPYSYHGFWCMPQKELKESINESFMTISEGREFNAMWVGWGLGKMPLVEIGNKQISKKCYSYHLPNNYALLEGSKNGKIKVDEVFI